MIEIPFMGAAFVLLVLVHLRYPRRVGRGKLTRLISRYFLPRRLWAYPWVRVTRFFVCAFVSFPLQDPAGAIAYWTFACVFLLDDLLFGDDDTWRRFRDAARNKIRWLMELPAPPVPTTA